MIVVRKKSSQKCCDSLSLNSKKINFKNDLNSDIGVFVYFLQFRS